MTNPTEPPRDSARTTEVTGHEGHRKRVRQRFLQQGLTGFEDYEALELILLFVARQQDMKPVAKALVARFGSFKAVLDAPDAELMEVPGVGESAMTIIRLIKEATVRYLKQTSRASFSIDQPKVLIDYCIAGMGAAPNERFRVICLNASFAIVDERDVAEGTVNQATVYPRRVVEIALAARASTLIFVHNHPDGAVTPSDFDKTLTRSLVLATKTIGITVYDHYIVSRDTYFSFREGGLL